MTFKSTGVEIFSSKTLKVPPEIADGMAKRGAMVAKYGLLYMPKLKKSKTKK